MESWVGLYPQWLFSTVFCLLRSRSLPAGMWMCLVAGVSCYQTLPNDPRNHFLESHSELGFIVGQHCTCVVVSGGLLGVIRSPDLS